MPLACAPPPSFNWSDGAVVTPLYLWSVICWCFCWV